MAKTRPQTQKKMRIYHRYLGFFLVGIMTIYSISGIVLIFRDTDAFKVNKSIEKTVKPNLNAKELAKELKVKSIAFKKSENETGIHEFEKSHYVESGTYNSKTGEAKIVAKVMPFILDKMLHLHKAKTKSSLFFLNIFFGLSLLFFVISSFWMYSPGTPTFKKGMYFVLGGIVLTLVLLYLR